MRPDPPDPLDRDFPLGDGVADTGAWSVCPCCGEDVELVLDPGGGPVQEYVEDCPVCCRPWVVLVRWGTDGTATVALRSEDQG